MTAVNVRDRLWSAAVSSLVTGAGLALILALTTACSSGGPAPGPSGPAGSSGSTTPAETGLLPQITVRRTGGFAGLSDTVTVDPHGGWTVTGRSGTPTAGPLSAEEITQLRALAADPRLAAEAHRTPPPTRCRDAFSYALTVDAVEVDYVDCPADPDQPAAAIALVERILQVTKLKTG